MGIIAFTDRPNKINKFTNVRFIGQMSKGHWTESDIFWKQQTRPLWPRASAENIGIRLFAAANEKRFWLIYFLKNILSILEKYIDFIYDVTVGYEERIIQSEAELVRTLSKNCLNCLKDPPRFNAQQSALFGSQNTGLCAARRRRAIGGMA